MTEATNFKELLQEHFVGLPKVGDAIAGKILSVASNEVRVDINGIAVGVVRGKEFYDDPRRTAALKVGDDVEALVLDLDNENAEVELSFRVAGSMRAWDALRALVDSKETLNVKITEANKGGLLATLNGVVGFLPVSQLSPQNYPRVQGGDKTKILEELRSFVGKEMKVKVLDANERENKLIFSEKNVWEEEQHEVISAYKVGDIIEGDITAITGFGAFVRFGDGLEGLIHISELAWQRIDHPSDVVAIGNHVRAQIIQIDGSKIFLSLKRLIEDPWRSVSERYKAGQVVRGTVLKVNPFGLFVELDKDIHGLAHVSELSDDTVENINDFAKPGEQFDFEVVNLEPAAHRLGLRIAGVQPKAQTKKPSEKTSSEETPAPDAQPS
ncbi:MAG: RNA binding S1 domain protein [Candidatus Magasanikbacteria bacterium GW2011_GWA2_46_17]|uniref:RNA binding S1 domain protein n=1 Tax=Candidatus Magasanikbacteria bacterium GW2011_GWA2_46_17 TaxID=1619042 RepID=A0A0G1P2X9_9BACT|nr:MAG: RNA binding S1 domain protein [Candidatus Magasanikbacteria bacterium GW2011_GWA2_46_17]HBF67179.1 30S ribosomal protein S1 [Candidatus Magasanikbacteria bacterium]